MPFDICRSFSSMKNFVKGSDVETHTRVTASSPTEVFKLNHGIDARKSYEEIIGRSELKLPGESSKGCDYPDASKGDFLSSVIREGNTEVKEKVCTTKLLCKPLKEGVVPSLSLVMKYAEENDFWSVMESLKANKSLLNSVDQFGWSVLMVAACAGAEKVVDQLLLSGADTKIRDRGGQTCVTLAQKKGHWNIVKMIQNFSSLNSTPQFSESTSRRMTFHEAAQLCPSCNTCVVDSQKRRHLTSTVHLLNKCSKGCKTYYSIPGNNRGYQLMLKEGWDGEKGLGPSGEGMKLPPKTVLKRDRKGLGASKGRARITHFHSNDYKAVASSHQEVRQSTRLQNKYYLKQKIQQEKLLERCLRWEMS